MVLGRLSQLLDSGESKSTLSRARTNKFGSDADLVIASERATAVAELRERSPMTRVAFGLEKASSSWRDLAREPLSVEGRKSRFGRGGNLPRRASGKTVVRVLIGKVWLMNSEIRTTVEKFWLLPPITATWPVFCSGIFQMRLSKSGFDCLCQYDKSELMVAKAISLGTPAQ